MWGFWGKRKMQVRLRTGDKEKRLLFCWLFIEADRIFHPGRCCLVRGTGCYRGVSFGCPCHSIIQSKEHLLSPLRATQCTQVFFKVKGNQNFQLCDGLALYDSFECLIYTTLTKAFCASHQCLHQQGQWLVTAGDAHRLAALPRGLGCRLGPQEHLLDWLGQQEHLCRHGRRQKEKSADSHWAERAACHRSGSTPRVSGRSLSDGGNGSVAKQVCRLDLWRIEKP